MAITEHRVYRISRRTSIQHLKNYSCKSYENVKVLLETFARVTQIWVNTMTNIYSSAID
jgi:hypothetical protein